MITKLPSELLSHPLWEGSLLQQFFQHKLLTHEKIVARVNAMKMCNDLTPKEKSLLRILETIKV